MSRPKKLIDNMVEKIIKPEKPLKTIIIKQSAEYYFADHFDKVVFLKKFLLWIKEVAPKDAKNVSINVYDYPHDYDNTEGRLSIFWERHLPNTKYQQRLKKSQRDLAKCERSRG